jgi:hypothetical protein
MTSKQFIDALNVSKGWNMQRKIGEQFVATHGTPLSVGETIKLSDGFIAEVTAYNGVTAFGNPWYEMKIVGQS